MKRYFVPGRLICAGRSQGRRTSQGSEKGLPGKNGRWGCCRILKIHLKRYFLSFEVHSSSVFYKFPEISHIHTLRADTILCNIIYQRIAEVQSESVEVNMKEFKDGKKLGHGHLGHIFRCFLISTEDFTTISASLKDSVAFVLTIVRKAQFLWVDLCRWLS